MHDLLLLIIVPNLVRSLSVADQQLSSLDQHLTNRVNNSRKWGVGLFKRSHQAEMLCLFVKFGLPGFEGY
jgi:hypothetical protein